MGPFGIVADVLIFVMLAVALLTGGWAILECTKRLPWLIAAAVAMVCGRRSPGWIAAH